MRFMNWTVPLASMVMTASPKVSVMVTRLSRYASPLAFS
jgi:hypothetical protein